MLKRRLTKELYTALKRFPAVVINGPRQVGKTTLAKSLSSKKKIVYLDLELPSHLLKLSDPEGFLRYNQKHLVIIDEVQRLPEIFPLLRALIDEDRSPGRFLLLGSASGSILHHSSESLAGRVKFLELTPFHLTEIKGAMDMHWWRGGFPEAFLSKNDTISTDWLDAFMRTFLERDLPAFNTKITPELIYRLFQMLAHIHGNVLNASELARSLDISPPTIKYYLDVLENAMLIRRLPPYHVNTKKRLVKSPKVYIRDSGLLHRLLNIPDFNDLFGHPKKGASWEGYVLEQICSILPQNITPYFYRTAKGAEIDLILVRGMEILQLIEVKHSKSPRFERGVYSVLQDLAQTSLIVAYPGSDTYPIKKGITITSLKDIIQNCLDK